MSKLTYRFISFIVSLLLVHLLTSLFLSYTFFVQGKKIIGASCASNDAKVVLLSSSTSGETRKYQCDCSGTQNTGVSKMYCSIHYWECWSKIWRISLGSHRWIDIFKLQAVMSTGTHFGPVLYACAPSILPVHTSEQPWTASSHKKGLISVA